MLKNLERTKRIWVKISEFRKSFCASLNPCKQFSVSIEGGGGGGKDFGTNRLVLSLE